jgi:hypothetical protein
MTFSPPPAEGGRDVRLDLARGLFVGLMIFGHLGWHELVPRTRLGFATLAEGFFALSGATLGLVAARADAAGRARTFDRRLLWRGIWLYGANLLLVAAARVLEGTRAFPGPFFDRYWRDTPELWRWLSFDQPSVLNVLPRYALFLALAPLVHAALRRGGHLAVLAASGALWAASWWSGGALLLPGFEGARAPYPAASWQLVFFAGMVAGYPRGRADRPRSGPWFGRPELLVAAAAVLVAAVFAADDPGPEVFGAWVSRPLLGPLRVVNILAAAAVLRWALTRWRGPLTRWTGWLLSPYGKAALPAFLLHAPVVWLFLALPVLDAHPGLRPPAAVAVLLVLLPLLRIPLVRRWLTP